MVAARRQLWHQAADFDERLEVAWAAIVEHIYTRDEPLRGEVIRARWQTIGTHVDKGHRFHGLYSHDRYAGVKAGFERYWWSVARPAPGLEERVAERVALAQIWPRLRPLHRQVLAALAACDDYGLAADSLGKSRKNLHPADRHRPALGVSAGTAMRHAFLAGADWSAYAARRRAPTSNAGGHEELP